MTNDAIVLSDEELANVTGGSRTNIFQLASNFTNQTNLVDGSTNVFALGAPTIDSRVGEAGRCGNLKWLYLRPQGNASGELHQQRQPKLDY